MPTWYRLAWIVICLTTCWILEGNFPLFRFHYQKWKHAGVNFTFLTTTMIINVIFGIITVGVFVWINNTTLVSCIILTSPFGWSCSSAF